MMASIQEGVLRCRIVRIWTVGVSTCRKSGSPLLSLCVHDDFAQEGEGSRLGGPSLHYALYVGGVDIARGLTTTIEDQALRKSFVENDSISENTFFANLLCTPRGRKTK